MIIGVDIGGTKTLVGLFDAAGSLLSEHKFATPTDKTLFAPTLKQELTQLNGWQEATVMSIASPGLVDPATQTVVSWGRNHMGWEDFSLKEALAEFAPQTLYLENDANLAALAEARALTPPQQLVLYITLSTGIGSGIIVENKLLPALRNSEAGQMMLAHVSGSSKLWEDYASGKQLHEHTHQLATDLADPKAWESYAQDLVLGLQPAIALLQPNIVVLGGGVGAHLDKFHGSLMKQLHKANQSPAVLLPEVVQAHYGEKSVLYGCFEYAKDQLA